MSKLQVCEINKRLMSGKWPGKRLRPVPPTNILDIIDLEKGVKGVKIIQQYEKAIRQIKPLFPNLFSSTVDRFNEMVEMIDKGRQNAVIAYVNAMINTGIYPQDLSPARVSEASLICPYITEIDKYLTFGIYISFQSYLILEKEESNLCRAFLLLLQIVQDKERRTGVTINIEAVEKSTSLVDAILEWDNGAKYLIPLSSLEKAEFDELIEKRHTINQNIQEDVKEVGTIEVQTKSDWLLFLQLIFEFEKREEKTISKIIDKQASVEEKLQAIEEYDRFLKSYKKGEVIIDEKQEKLTPILRSVSQRFGKMPWLTKVIDDEGEEQFLDQRILLLAAEGVDFYSFLIKYHHFRLCPCCVEVAKDFFQMSASYIQRNLLNQDGGPYKQLTVLESARLFDKVVFDFYQENKEVIEQLSFLELQDSGIIQDNNVLVEESAYRFFNDTFNCIHDRIEQENKTIDDLSREYNNDSLSDEEFNCLFEQYAVDVINRLFTDVVSGKFKNYLQYEKETVARQIVVSLDMVFLVRDALRIVLQTPYRYDIAKEEEITEVVEIERRLTRLDQTISCEVYKGIPWEERNLQTARRETGVDAQPLAESERDVEIARKEAFISALESYMASLEDCIENNNSIEPLIIKSKIQKELNCLTKCHDMHTIVDRVESINRTLSKALVRIQQNNVESFARKKEDIQKQLGEESKRLPPATMDSLTTAEVLYEQYVTESFAREGFDYSCISSLYYQAFEEAYNALIWRPYANKLNQLELNGTPFSIVLRKKNKTEETTQAVKAYFFPEYQDWKNYTEKGSYRMSNSCMFGPFARLMKEVVEQKDLVHFREYFAQTAGFSSEKEMQDNTRYITEFKQFIECVERCTVDRNKASHGGLCIDAEQCRVDKLRVISNLESVRKDSIGLIQQLLYLMKRNTYVKPI